jgi:hypothetical protein
MAGIVMLAEESLSAVRPPEAAAVTTKLYGVPVLRRSNTHVVARVFVHRAGALASGLDVTE